MMKEVSRVLFRVLQKVKRATPSQTHTALFAFMLPSRLAQRLNAQLSIAKQLAKGYRGYHSKHGLLDELKLRGLMAQVTR